jgi:hypothetical protein
VDTGRWQISTDGGTRPHWRRDGRELFYDVSPDGQRFLMIKNAEADAKVSPPQIIVVQNWDQELKRLVPTK